MVKNMDEIVEARGRDYLTKLIIVLGAIVLVLLMLLSMTRGAARIPVTTVIEAFRSFNPEDSKHLLVVDMRLPRVIASALVGSALAVSGALMQGMTRNPLADSGLMGLSTGAALAIAICFAYFTGVSYGQIIIFSFLGAALGASLVYGISGLVPGENSPMKLVLAGAAVSTLLLALCQGIAIASKITQNLTFWTMGSVSGTSWSQLRLAAPIIIMSILAAVAISGNISVLNMGKEVAVGLGLKVGYVRILGTLLVVLLAGTSVALSGTITFVGMLVPHLSRFLVGPDYRRIIPTSGVLGAILLVAADIGAKSLKPPTEIPIGAIIALLGVPVFLYFANRQGGDL